MSHTCVCAVEDHLLLLKLLQVRRSRGRYRRGLGFEAYTIVLVGGGVIVVVVSLFMLVKCSPDHSQISRNALQSQEKAEDL